MKRRSVRCWFARHASRAAARPATTLTAIAYGQHARCPRCDRLIPKK